MVRVIIIRNGKKTADVEGNINDIIYDEENYDYFVEYETEYGTDVEVMEDEEYVVVKEVLIEPVIKVYIDGSVLIIHTYSTPEKENLKE